MAKRSGQAAKPPLSLWLMQPTGLLDGNDPGVRQHVDNIVTAVQVLGTEVVMGVLAALVKFDAETETYLAVPARKGTSRAPRAAKCKRTPRKPKA